MDSEERKKWGICVIIPALNPEVELLDYIESLVRNEIVQQVLLVDDGSDSDHVSVFSKAITISNVTVLTHAVNMGKGRALKDAFNYYLVNLSRIANGVITVDSDGQHALDDVFDISLKMQEESNALILGCRNFDNPVVPFKSKFGNKLTKFIFKNLIGGNISDTQTGLRGIPNNLLKRFLDLPGERFDYETNMLIDCIKNSVSISEISIDTIYIDNNSETHFDPIKDSMTIYCRIFSTFFKYLGSSLVSFLIDYLLFCFLLTSLPLASISGKIWGATILARIFSSLFNYTINKTIVFQSNVSKKTIIQYYILCFCQMFFSALFVSMLSTSHVFVAQIGKIIVDVCLFLISFQIQNKLIFKKGRH